MSKIHYATGGLITPEKSEYATLCNCKFPTGGSGIMQSGYMGAKNVTCEDCRTKLDYDQKKSEFLDRFQALIQKARGNDELAKKLMYATTLIKNLF